jgi:oligopeptidase B
MLRRLVAALLLPVLLACAPAPPPPSIAAVTTATSPSAPLSPPAEGPRPPIAPRQPHETDLFGHKLVDDYFWMRNKGAPEVESYLAAENAYTAAMTGGTASLQQTLYDEMVARIQQDDATPPVQDSGWLYYERFEKGKQYPIHCRRKAGVKDAPEAVILDLNASGKDHSFVAVPDMVVSDDGNTLAYLLDTVGYRQFTLQVEDLKTGRLGPEAIPRVDSVAFAKDGKTLLYVTEDAQTKRADKLWRHTLGDDAAKDTLVYEEKDEMFEVWVRRTRSKAYIIATSGSHTTSEVRIIDAARPASPPRVVAPREHDHEYYVDHRGDLFYIRTNSGGRNFRIVTAPVASPGRDHWKELVPPRDDVMLEGLELFRDQMVVAERQDALPQLSIYDFKTGKTSRIDQPEPVFDVDLDANPEFSSRTLRFKYQSLRTPLTWIDVDLTSQKRQVVKKTEVPGGYDEAAYESKRIQLPARDGTPVPVSLVYRKGTTSDGTHPLFLYGYGSYGYAIPLTFKSDRASLLDRGMVWALAHVRGGGDLGKKWHDRGRMLSKMNTFTDFIDVAEGLQRAGWTSQGGIVAQGASAGGLLMGAIANMRPDLFKVVLAFVPWVDVMNDMLDDTLPLTAGEFEEWGNPKKKDECDYMMQYSPYDNVSAKSYPAMLVRSSYNDSQVMYWGPAKWVARLRATKTDGNPLLLAMNMDPAGHGGKSGRYDRLHDVAFDYAFVLTQLGLAH